MRMSQRDKILLLVLPAMLVALGYGLFFLLPGMKTRAKLEKDLAAARGKLPSSAETAQAASRLRQADESLARAKKQQQELQTAWQELTRPCVNHSRRADRWTCLMSLLKRHQIHVVDHAPHDGTAKHKTSLPLEKLARSIAEQHTQEQPQLWRLHLVGSYLSVLKALEDLGSGEAVAIPVSLSMTRPDTATKLREWTILLWI